MSRLAALRSDERGFAMVLGVTLMTLLATVSLTLLDLAQGESLRSRRDAKSDGAYQAAEAATNAYLSDLTESQVFPTSYTAKGEQTRIDAGGVVHAGSSTADVPWSSGTSWTYGRAPASDPDWFDLGNGYQYLLQVYPAGGVSGPAQTITRIEAIGRPAGSTDYTTWTTIETMLRPTSLADFQTFVATSITYGASATTYGPIFVGEDKTGTPGNLTHWGTAQANLYAEGSVFGNPTLQNGAKKYDKNSIPTALCKLNNCSPIPFSTFSSTLTTVSGAAASGGVSLAATDPTNSALSTQAYGVDAWQIAFLPNGTMLVSSCKKYKSGTTTYEVYDGSNAPVCGPPTLRNVPANGAIYSAVDVIVSGTLHGRVTVATSADVVIGGNTTYVTSGSDVLGLEAQGSIYIAPWAVTGPSLTVYAAALALNGPFTADPKWIGSATATFNYYGSIAAYGSASGAIVMSNLFAARSYYYDTTLKFLQPPYFPSLGNAFTILLQRQL